MSYSFCGTLQNKVHLKKDSNIIKLTTDYETTDHVYCVVEISTKVCMLIAHAISLYLKTKLRAKMRARSSANRYDARPT